MFGIKGIRWTIIAAAIAAAPLGAILPADFTTDAPVVSAVALVSDSTDDPAGEGESHWQTADGEDTVITLPVDFLTLDYFTAPAYVWDAVSESPAVMYVDGDDTTVYVPVGSFFDVPGGFVRATTAGFWQCEDWSSTGAECSANDSGEPAAWDGFAGDRLVPGDGTENYYGAPGTNTYGG